MHVVWGSRLYGKTDEVPGFFHVETKFGHVQFLPLFPIRTYLIFSKNGAAWNGITIRDRPMP